MKLYHTYKKEKVELKPINPPNVTVYNCGPTVYETMTIGNIRAYVFDDILRRALDYNGLKTKQVMNITDVGHITMTKEQKKAAGDVEITDSETGIDRMEKAAQAEGLTVWQVADKYIAKIFGENYQKAKTFSKDSIFGQMNILKPDILCRATDHIEEQIALIKILEEKGFTYTTAEAVYFDVSKFTEYEKLTGQKLSEMNTASRQEVKIDPDKKHPADFRLWQLNQPEHAMLWESPWGKGYPGWHIECSAMANKYLGNTVDIHTGGIDHVKVHHPNEMAQSQSAYQQELANIWLHNEFLLVDGKRMGKSLNNAYTLTDLSERNFTGLDLRYLFLQTHYRSKLNFTWESLGAAQNALQNLLQKIIENIDDYDQATKVNSELEQKFKDLINDDLNTPQALALLWDTLKDDKVSKNDKLAFAFAADKVLGLNLAQTAFQKTDIPQKIKKLAEQRQLARQNQDWGKADSLRQQMKAAGYVIEDSGTDFHLWKKD